MGPNQDPGRMSGRRIEKQDVGRRSLNNLTKLTSDRPQLLVITNGRSGDELTKSGGREVFFGGGTRRDRRCASRSAVAGREAQRRREPLQRLEATRY